MRIRRNKFPFMTSVSAPRLASLPTTALYNTAARPHVAAFTDVDVINFHDAIFKQMSLRAGEGIDFTA
jgi:hypothetical protein